MAVQPSDLARELARRGKLALAIEAQRAGEVRGLVNAEVAALLADGLARRAWLIGSLAWGHFGVRSDVDVVLEGLAPDRIGAAADRIARRVRTEVDVLRIEDLPDSFIRRVLADGVELVA